MLYLCCVEVMALLEDGTSRTGGRTRLLALKSHAKCEAWHKGTARPHIIPSGFHIRSCMRHNQAPEDAMLNAMERGRASNKGQKMGLIEGLN